MSKEEIIKELSKVNGLGKGQAEYLYNAGIFSIEELKKQNVFELSKNLVEKGNVGYKISEKTISEWILEANKEDYLYFQAEKRWESLRDRTFEEKLKFLLFAKLILKMNISLIDEIVNEINELITEDFKKTFDNMAAVRENNAIIEKWRKDKENLNDIKKLWDLYKEYFEKQLSKDKFRKFYKKDTEDRICVYCKIKESEIHNLINRKEIKTKRIYSRGKSFEIDRENPNGKYVIGNIVLSCYWCNNAKSDEFTFDEFMLIGESIGRVWKSRLNNE